MNLKFWKKQLIEEEKAIVKQPDKCHMVIYTNKNNVIASFYTIESKTVESFMEVVDWFEKHPDDVFKMNLQNGCTAFKWDDISHIEITNHIKNKGE